MPSRLLEALRNAIEPHSWLSHSSLLHENKPEVRRFVVVLPLKATTFEIGSSFSQELRQRETRERKTEQQNS